MNIFDLLIVLLFGLIVGASFVGGLGRVFATLVGLYLAVIVAAFFYHPFSAVIKSVLRGVSSFTGDLVAFALLLLISTLIVSLALGRSFVLDRLPRFLGPLNNLSGAVLGILVAVAGTVLASMIISLSLQTLDRTAALGGGPVLVDVQRQMAESALVPMFLKLVPTFTSAIKPWFPSGLPPILAPGGPA